jgi:arylformamidase
VNWCNANGSVTVSVDNAPWRQWSLADREREYSPSTTVASLDDELQRYRDLSDAARLRCPPTVERYGPKPDETIDLYRPDDAEPTPVVVYLHGGYWQRLSKDDSAFMVSGLLDQHIATAVVDYTLAPHASLYEIVDQCVRAVRYVIDHCARLRLDHSRVIVAGSSAGGHLAAMVAHQLDVHELTGAVCISGVFDLEPLLGTYINDALGLNERDVVVLSPMRQMRRDGLCRMVICVGENESAEFHRQSRDYTRALHETGADVSCVTLTARHHFDAPLDLGNMCSQLGREVARLVAQRD